MILVNPFLKSGVALTGGFRLSGAIGLRAAYNGDYARVADYNGFPCYSDGSHYIWTTGTTWFASTNPGSSPDLYGPTATTPNGGAWSDGSNPVTITAI